MANTWFAVYLCNIWRKKLLTVLYLIPCVLIYIKNEQLWGYGSYTSLQDIEPFWLPSLWPSGPFDSLSLLPLWPIHQAYYYYCIRIGEAYQIFYVSVVGKKAWLRKISEDTLSGQICCGPSKIPCWIYRASMHSAMRGWSLQPPLLTISSLLVLWPCWRRSVLLLLWFIYTLQFTPNTVIEFMEVPLKANARPRGWWCKCVVMRQNMASSLSHSSFGWP